MTVFFLKLAGYLAKLPRNTRNILQTCLYGVAAGFAVVAFQWLITFLYSHTFVPLSSQSHLTFVVGSFGVMVGSALAVGILLHSFCPEAAGSGIPQAKAAFWKDFGVITWRTVWVKFVAGVLAIGGGGSLGREGPSVHLASGLASILAGLTGEAKQNRRRATASGAAVGLAAAFNAPLSAMAFVLEEIIQDLNSNLLGSVVVASVIGALIVHGLIGRQPAFAMRPIEAPTWRAYALTPLAAIVASLAGVYFQKLTLALRARQRGWKKIPGWLKPAVGAALAWGIGTSVFLLTGHLGVFSLGYDDLSEGLDNQLAWGNHFGWELAGCLLVAKLFATILSYGFGGCGGIFSPTLFFGGMSGLLVAGLFGMAMPMPGDDSITLAVVGMSACLGAVVRAPVTGILIVFEMTHEFSLVPILMIGALISQAISRRMLRENFYDAILEQDGYKLEKLLPPRDLQSWQKLPVSAIANFQPVVLNGTEPVEVEKTLSEHAFTNFPVMHRGAPVGIASRAELAEALAEKRTPKLAPVVCCEPRQTIRELQALLLESPSGMAVVCDGPKLLGIVTLHDLLRAQINAAQNSV
ncbi:MAG TPA: chloride channel protein [Verrucomicrobiae bacterium]|jgi:CIC family chloride channel protein|nr:chloride channel protein [Verrucomicrobiae bacterium]